MEETSNMNDLCGIACSILNYYGLKAINPSFDRLDELLGERKNKKFNKIALVLLDGLGIKNIEASIGKDSFFYRHIYESCSSVFPPTTVAATTSVQSGLYPCQHGWLGWTNYYKPIDRSLTVFLNSDSETGEKLEDEPVALRLCPYETLWDRINAANIGVKAHYLSSYGGTAFESPKELAELIRGIFESEEESFTYAYWPFPDHYMHMYGPDSNEVRDNILDLQENIKSVADFLPDDALLLVIADHGQILSEQYLLDSFEDITRHLLRRPTIESRASSYFIKEGEKEAFRESFNRHFGDCYELIEKDEAIKRELFGPMHDVHPLFLDMLGDFIALARTEKTLFLSRGEMEHCRGVHAGSMEKERLIPLMAFYN